MNESERIDPYWICSSCATKKGWVPFKTGNTMIMGLCGYCGTGHEEMLTPVCDFKKPKDKKGDKSGQ